MCMSIALELRGITKRYAVGIAGCMASADVLRSVTVEAREGEAIAILGGPAAGKSTLLFCAAGLMVPESGDVRWFGDCDRASAVERATYHFAGRHLRPHLHRQHLRRPHLHLLDGLDALPGDVIARVADWIERRRLRGDTILLATRDAAVADRLATRSLTLRAGQLYGEGRSAMPARVAERAS